MTIETSIFPPIKLEVKKRAPAPRLKASAAVPLLLILISAIPSANAQSGADYRSAIQNALRQKYTPTNFGCYDIPTPGIFGAPGSQKLESGETLTLRGEQQIPGFKTRLGDVKSGGKIEATIGAYQEPSGPEITTVCPTGNE